MSEEKLKWAQRAPITYYSVAGAKGKIVTRWIEPPEGYNEAGIITIFYGFSIDFQGFTEL